MARIALIPGSPRDPTGIDRVAQGAINEMRRRFRLIGRLYRKIALQLPAQPVVNARYEFMLDSMLLNQILGSASEMIDSVLLEGGEQRLWLFEKYVSVAYDRGLAQEFANLSHQSPAYKAGRQSVANIKQMDPMQRRMMLTRARAFEEMKGLSQESKADLARVLTEGIGRGLNPKTIATNITDRIPMSANRGVRIARTETTMALKRAKWDEAEEATEEYGLKSKEMHLSALSPTTRATHAARHAHLYTVEEVRDWWSQDANAINCKCSTTTVLVDSKGEPLVPGIVERAKSAIKPRK